MELIQSQKGKDLLLSDGYRYRKARTNTDGSVSWRCAETPCRGRVKVSLENVMVNVTRHSHAPDPAKNEAKKSVSNMKRRAADTLEKPRQLIQGSTRGINLEASVHFPSYNASQRTVERIRQRREVSCPNPGSVADINIPVALQVTSRNLNFLLWDSGQNDPHRIFMFGTEENLEVLEEHRHWHVDGTFKVAPQLFLQVFTIHALVDNRSIPLIYVLLQDKREETYVRVFQKLMELKPTLNPISCLSDFEKAIQNAVCQVFHGVQVMGCLFHLGQCLWRKIQELHLVEEYRNDENVRMHLKMLLALSFVQEGDVITAFEELTESCPREIDAVIDYWEDTYIGRQRRNRRADPKFPIHVWNVHDRVHQGLPRTNNSVEGWHHAFQHTVDCHHPCIFKLIDHFRKEQDRVEIELERFRDGFRNPEASKKKYVQLNRRLETLMGNYNNDDLLPYLRGISNNLTL
ncbi:unnamed protein product [Parnassius mnemosyne]|uniref:MULE transposase domain-containing protein n=1 Tax=Parnassius mnemosyne TaxID=213953 RepID=A0AAV1L8F8_9NEOP